MSDQPNGKTTLHDYVAVLRRRKWIVLQAVILVPVVAVLLSQLQEPQYEASSLVLLKRQSLAATVTGSQDPNILQDPALLGRTQAQVAQIPALGARVLRATGISDRSASEFLASSRVEPVAQTDVLLRFTVRDRDPEIAERLATAYAQEYNLYRRDLDTAAYEAARRQLEERLRKLRGSGVDTDSSLYASLLEKHQTLVTLSALQLSNASVLRAAEGAAQVSPRTRLNGILGLFIGIVLGLGLAFLRETFDRRVRSAEDFSILDLPLLGRLPGPPRQAKPGELAMISRPSTAEAESFRLLRANLELTNVARQARTIMVTSASRGEGKTTTIANLAVALARAGRHVALIDLDLRDPSIDRIFRLDKRPGLADVVLGDVPLADALTRVPLAAAGVIDASGKAPTIAAGTLDVLPAGSTPPNPGEFVASSAVAKVLDNLSEIADLVLVDAPPLLAVSDAVTLGARVDAVFVTVRLNVTDRAILDDLARALSACPCAKLGYVLTGAEPHEGYAVSASTESERPRERPPKVVRQRPVEALEPAQESGSSKPRWV